MNNVSTISIPRYHAAYNNKIIEKIASIGSSYKNNTPLQLDVENRQDRYIINLENGLLTSLNLNSSYFYEYANKILCHIENHELINRNIILLDANDNVFLQRLAIKYQSIDDCITLVKCDEHHNHIEDNLFEKIKNQPNHEFYPLINQDASYELLQQHGLIPSRTSIMCTSCDINIPYNTLSTETADPQSILAIAMRYHKNSDMISELMLTDYEIIYYCKNKTEYSTLVQLHNIKKDIPLAHYHKLKIPPSYDIYDNTPIKFLYDMSEIYFFTLPSPKSTTGNYIVTKYINYLCDDLTKDLVSVGHLSNKNTFLKKASMYLHSIATFICEHSNYDDIIEQQIDHGLRLLEALVEIFIENGLPKGFFSVLYGGTVSPTTNYLQTTNIYYTNNIKYDRIFNSVEAINQLCLFPLLEIIINFMAVLNLDQADPNSEFITRLLTLLPTAYLFPTSNEQFTKQHQLDCLLNAISQAKK